MKRTGFINLEQMRKQIFRPVLKPLVAAMAGVSLIGCGDSEEVRIFASMDECRSALPDQVEACETAYQAALKESQSTAPKYASRSDCEYDFGHDRCVVYQTDTGTNWFMPAMAGFMLGQALNRGEREYNYYHSSPIYRPSSYSSPVWDKWVTSDGRVVADSRQQRVKVDSDVFKPKPATRTTLSRGGFGSTSVAKSSWGSSRSSWGG